MPQRPRILSADELAAWRAEDAQKREATATRAESLKQEFGDKFAQQAGYVENDNVRELAVDRMAAMYAERKTRPDLVDGRTASDIRDEAVTYAEKLDTHQLMNDLGPYAPEPPEVEATPEQKAESVELTDGADKAPAQSIDPAAPDRHGAETPIREAEADPALNVEQDPLREIEAAPEPEIEPEPEPPYRPHQFELREEIRRDAQGLDYSELPAEGALDQLRTPEVEPVIEPVAQDGHAAPDREMEPAEIASQAASQEPQQQPETEPKRLRFYEDLKQEHANAIGNGQDKADRSEKEQGDAGQKKLNFFEDKGPSQDQGLDH